MTANLSAEDLIKILQGWALPTGAEARLQLALVQVFEAANLDFRREVQVTGGRIDFLVGCLGVECKVDGSYQKVAEQLLRYSEDSCISGLVLVTTRAVHRKLDGSSLLGKDVRVYFVHPFS